LSNVNTKDLIKTVIAALEDKKAEDIKVLDIHEISTMSEYFVMASANNVNQVKAIADEVEEKLYEQGAKLIQSEGYQSARWVLLDFNDIIVHIFHKEDREFYQLERVWADAKEITL
jgi:ribosome-associated protein